MSSLLFVTKLDNNLNTKWGFSGVYRYEELLKKTKKNQKKNQTNP